MYDFRQKKKKKPKKLMNIHLRETVWIAFGLDVTAKQRIRKTCIVSSLWKVIMIIIIPRKRNFVTFVLLLGSSRFRRPLFDSVEFDSETKAYINFGILITVVVVVAATI